MLATCEVEKSDLVEKDRTQLKKIKTKLPIVEVTQKELKKVIKEHDEWDEGHDENGAKGGAKENEDWSPTAVSSLLDAWGDKYQAANNGKLTMKNWCQVSNEVSIRCAKTKKPKGVFQCKQKVKALKRRYNREKMAKRFPTSAPSSWEFYDVMNVILGETPKFEVTTIDDREVTPSSGENGLLLDSKPGGEKMKGPITGVEDVRTHNHVTLPKEEEAPAVYDAVLNTRLRTTKLVPKESPAAVKTPRSESSYYMKQKRKSTALNEKDAYKHRDYRTTRSVITSLLRIAEKPSYKRKIRTSTRQYVEETNMVSALMTFGAMIQHLERNQTAMMEKVLMEQSQVLADFVKTLKHNNQVREVTKY